MTLLEALKNATLTINGAGTNTITKKVTVIASSASGYQFEVLPETASADVVWRETFEADLLLAMHGQGHSQVWRMLIGSC